MLDALTGVDFVITHLDGRTIRIKNKQGDTIKPGQVMTCEGLGLPFHKTSYEFGNLFITFNVKFPDTLNDKQMGVVEDVLSA